MIDGQADQLDRAENCQTIKIKICLKEFNPSFQFGVDTFHPTPKHNLSDIHHRPYMQPVPHDAKFGDFKRCQVPRLFTVIVFAARGCRSINSPKAPGRGAARLPPKWFFWRGTIISKPWTSCKGCVNVHEYYVLKRRESQLAQTPMHVGTWHGG